MIAFWLATALAGTWHLDLQMASEAKVPVLGWQKSTTETQALVHIDDDGIWSHEVCAVRIRDKAPLAKTELPPAFIAALPATVTRAEFDEESLRVDLGMSRVGFTDGPLPETADDPAVLDHESDGRPGGTINITITGFGTFGIEVVQESHAVLLGTKDEDGYRGTIETLLLNQRVLGADHRMLNTTPEIRAQDERSWFTLKPTSATSCVDLTA